MTIAKALRLAIVNQLTNNTNAGARVYGTRLRAHFRETFPYISVYTVSDSPLRKTVHDAEYERTLNVYVEAVIDAPAQSASSDNQDALDDLVTQIEGLLAYKTNYGVNGISDNNYVDLRYEYAGEELEKNYLLAILNFEVMYYETFIDPAEASAPELATVTFPDFSNPKVITNP